MRGIVEDICCERRRAEACVDTEIVIRIWMKGGTREEPGTVPSGEPLVRVRGKSSPCRLLLLRQVCVGKQTLAW